MRRSLRVRILLIVLALVAGMTFGERWWVRDWEHPLEVAIYPVAVDPTSVAFVAQLKPEDFQEIGTFLAGQGERWRHKATPTPHIVLERPIADLPPVDEPRSGWDAIRLSLRLRWYAFRHTPFWASLGTIRLFVLCHEPKPDLALPDSHGLQKGLVGIVHVFADGGQQAQNNIVIVHELLHTLGATDKYDASGQPIYPIGFADSTADPRYPQLKAEIMAGRVPITATTAEMPKSLADTVVGYATASEIGW